MKYISLFSGIGGFEVAIHNIFPEAQCLAYSDIKKTAIHVYKNHFPDHHNLGDISLISKQTILNTVKNGCDLIVGGFPCKNLSSLAAITGSNSGLKGCHSGLFYHMLKILCWVREIHPNTHFILENNASMSNKNKELIRKTLTSKLGFEPHENIINASSFGVQSRKRIFWTSFKISETISPCVIQTWNDVLERVNTVKPISDNYVKCMNKCIKTRYNPKKLIQVEKDNIGYKMVISDNIGNGKSRWQSSFHSDTANSTDKISYTYPIGKSRVVTASFGNHNILLDRRGKKKWIFYTENVHGFRSRKIIWVMPIIGHLVCRHDDPEKNVLVIQLS